MSAFSVLALGSALAACGSDLPTEPVRFDLPIGPAHRAVIVGVQVDDELVALVAADIVDGGIPPVLQDFPPAGRVEVTALLYDTPLASQGLQPGTVAPASNSDVARPLPASVEVHQARLGAATFVQWSRTDILPAALAGFRVPAFDSCVRFDPEEVSLGDVSPPTSVLALDDTWALVMTEGAEVFFVDGSRVVRQAVPLPLFSGYRRTDGSVWLGGADGAIFRGTFTANPEPQLELTRDGTVLSREAVIDLVGAPDGPLEHFALTSNRQEQTWGALEWFDGETWRMPGVPRNTPHDATWVEPGFGLFASFFRGGDMFGARDGEEVSIQVTTVLFGNVVVIEQVPGFGLVAATTAGDVHLKAEGGEWRRIFGSTTQRIGDVHGYEDGLVFLRGAGVGHYPADGAECPDSALFASDFEALDRMDVVGKHVVVPLVAREGTSVAEQHVGWFRARVRD